MAAYAMAKEAMRALTRVAAVEWGRHGIRALVLCPFTETDGMTTFEDEMGLSRGARTCCPMYRSDASVILRPMWDAWWRSWHPMTPDSLTGSTLMVDGGYTYMR